MSGPQQERLAIASVFDQRVRLTGSVDLSLSQFDSLLRQSDYQCGLFDILEALSPDAPLQTQKERQIDHQQKVAGFQRKMREQTDRFALASPARGWLEQGAHGQNWCIQRYKQQATTSEQNQDQILDRIGMIAMLLNHLSHSVQAEGLAIFAENHYGDPHALDISNEEGRLFYYALSDLLSLQTGTSFPIESRAAREQVYAAFGLYLTSLLSVVHVSGNLTVQCEHGHALTSQKRDSTEIQPLSLTTLRQWFGCDSNTSDIYIVENLTVFRALHQRSVHLFQKPILVCGSGWPSRAVYQLLDFFIAARPTVYLWYSGDFDLAGLRICHALQQRYPHNCHLWHMDADSYKYALHERRHTIPEKALPALKAFPIHFHPLTEAMLYYNAWAYQEGMLSLLWNDLCP
jgi:uncharacterized protein (TIGR02679 family)